MSKLYPWEVPYTILLLSPLLATILSLTYLSVKSGVDELLTIKEKFTSINRKIIFILISYAKNSKKSINVPDTLLQVSGTV